MTYFSWRSKLSLKIILGAVFVGVSFSVQASAQEQPVQTGPDQHTEQHTAQHTNWHGFTSFMVGYAPEFEGADENKAVPFGSIYIQKGQYYLQTEGAGFVANIWKNNLGLTAGPAFNFRLKRDDDVENIYVRNMTPVKSALELGGFVGYSTHIANERDVFEIRVKGLYDVNNAHDGFIVEGSMSYRTSLSPQIVMGVSLATSYADEDYNQTYFGVSQQDAGLSGLSQYTAGSGFKDVSAGVNINYKIYKGWGLFGVVNYSKLLGDAKNSSIIKNGGNENGYFTALGISYQF